MDIILKTVEMKALDGILYHLYEVPEFILGEPNYNIVDCCNYITCELKKEKLRMAKMPGGVYGITYNPVHVKGSSTKKTARDIAAFYNMTVYDDFEGL